MTPEQLRILVRTIYAAIAESGDNGIPSGHLYAAVMNMMDLDQYNRIIDAMLDHQLITRTNHLLKVKKT